MLRRRQVLKAFRAEALLRRMEIDAGTRGEGCDYDYLRGQRETFHLAMLRGPKLPARELQMITWTASFGGDQAKESAARGIADAVDELHTLYGQLEREFGVR